MTPLVVVVADRAHARFFEVSPAKAVEVSCLVLEAARGGRFHGDRRDSPGSGERRFHARRREEIRRGEAQVGRELRRLLAARPGASLVVAGPGIAAARFRDALPVDLRRRVSRTIRLNPLEVTAARVYQATVRRPQPTA